MKVIIILCTIFAFYCSNIFVYDVCIDGIYYNLDDTYSIATVTYEKKDDIASSTKYEDEFINNQVFSWMTRSRVSADSIESTKLIASSDSGLKILLFVKKSDGEGTDFYYMGRVHPIAWEQKEIYNDKGIALPIMNFRLKLEHSVREDIYQYFVCT